MTDHDQRIVDHLPEVTRCVSEGPSWPNNCMSHRDSKSQQPDSARFRSFRPDVPLMILAGLLILAGCAKQSADATEDSAHAKYVLVTALEAWKQGETNSLSTRKPAIRFADDDQRSGLELVEYEFENEANAVLPFQNVVLYLVLKNQRGETVHKTVTYQVGVEPKLTVLRSDN